MSPSIHQNEPSSYALTSSYPSPQHKRTLALQQQQQQQQQLGQGLGLYFAPSQNDLNGSMAPSTPELWQRPVSTVQATLPSTQAPPDIFSAAYDPFVSYHPQAQPSFLNAGVSASPSMVPELSSSPSSSCNMSSRSSDSYGRLDALSRHRSDEINSYKIKAEETADWLAQHAQDSTSKAILPCQGYFATSRAPYDASMDAQSFEDASDWSSMTSRDGRTSTLTDNGDCRSSKFGDDGAIITNVARTRKRRQLTTAADANHECGICGKLFGRSYNFKAHMETHDPTRIYAHLCVMKHCGKKFVRKTDLMRHNQSVHMKQRNYQCGLCNNLFARKDTLRRHTEDGCSKRFEISSKVLRTSEVLPDSEPLGSSRAAIGTVSMRSRHGVGEAAYSSTASISHGGYGGLPPLTQAGVFERPVYSGQGSGYYW